MTDEEIRNFGKQVYQSNDKLAIESFRMFFGDNIKYYPEEAITLEMSLSALDDNLGNLMYIPKDLQESPEVLQAVSDLVEHARERINTMALFQKVTIDDFKEKLLSYSKSETLKLYLMLI